MALLMKVVLCDIHNKYVPSEFKILNNKYKSVFDINVFGAKATKIDGTGRGEVLVEAKEKVEYLYNQLKGE